MEKIRVIHRARGAHDLTIFSNFWRLIGATEAYTRLELDRLLARKAENASFAYMFLSCIMFIKYDVDVFCMTMYNTGFDLNIYEVFVLESTYQT